MNDLDRLLDHSVEIIREHQADTGAYLASPTFPPYQYSWLRDGAFIADALSRVGDPRSGDRFFDWCAQVIVAREPRITQLIAREAAGETVGIEEHLHTRYTVDGQESVEPWWTFQLDGYGTWLWALIEYTRRHQRTLSDRAEAVDLTVRYLAAFWDHPCYDWWEEQPDQRHTSTLASVVAGLEAVAASPTFEDSLRDLAGRTAKDARARIDADGVRDGHLTKWLGAPALDASLIACIVPFGLYPVEDPIARETVTQIEQHLAPGGVHRYLDDVYYGGGQWILLTAWLGWYHAEVGDTGRANDLLDWIVAQADPTGNLPEQVNDQLLHPEHEPRWVERWGPSANPLLWSHAMLLTLAHRLGHTPPSMRASEVEA